MSAIVLLIVFGLGMVWGIAFAAMCFTAPDEYELWEDGGE